MATILQIELESVRKEENVVSSKSESVFNLKSHARKKARPHLARARIHTTLRRRLFSRNRYTCYQTHFISFPFSTSSSPELKNIRRSCRIPKLGRLEETNYRAVYTTRRTNCGPITACSLLIALQGARSWYTGIDSVLIEYGLEKIRSD